MRISDYIYFGQAKLLDILQDILPILDILPTLDILKPVVLSNYLLNILKPIVLSNYLLNIVMDSLENWSGNEKVENHCFKICLFFNTSTMKVI